ncbi:MAG: ABC transporter ATP-binding protein [Myxococcota bacterium]|nr:ABC transporter ATP-binding protein [Myxococcota bacterium]
MDRKSIQQRPTTAPRPPALEALGLSRSYGEHLAVDNVSFEIFPGEVFGLLGPNGAGKTSLLRMLSGILEPDRGHARINGERVTRDAHHLRRGLGYLSGDTSLYGRLSVVEMLTYFGQLHGMTKEQLDSRIDRMVNDFGLESFKAQRCGALSSGQSQRANLARAFISNPKIVILDEPTVGLDVISGEFVVQAIERARSERKAVLFSTHIMSEVDKLCDRIGLLLRGQLKAVGSRADLLKSFKVSDLSELILSLHKEDHRP